MSGKPGPTRTAYNWLAMYNGGVSILEIPHGMLRFTMRAVRVGALCFLLFCLPLGARAANGQSNQAGSPWVYMKVRLKSELKIRDLKVGSVVAGSLSQPVYVGTHELMPAGSVVRLTVDHFERRRRTKNDHWPWIVQVFTPRHENYPAFQSASVTLPGGAELPLQVSFLSIADEREIDAQHVKSPHHSASMKPRTATNSANPIVTLEATIPQSDSAILASRPPEASDRGPTEGPVALEAGAQAQVILLDTLSASKSKAGDPIEARLVEPMRVGSAVALPEGTLFQGRVVKVTRPKWLSRSGSLLITFDNLTWRQGSGRPIVASVTGAEVDRRSHMRIDSEGEMRGARPGRAWMLINLGVTAGIAKETDDSLQLVIEAIVSSATDASTAGTTRIVAACVSGIFMVSRHGRDVVLPKFAQIRITLNRPLTLPQSSVSISPITPSQ